MRLHLTHSFNLNTLLTTPHSPVSHSSISQPPIAISQESVASSSGSISRDREASPRSPAVKREAAELLVPKREAGEPERDSPTMETRHAGYGAPPDQRSPYERPPDDHVRSYR